MFHRITVFLMFLLIYLPFSAAGSQRGTIHMDFDLSAHAPGEEVRLWIPYPVSDAHQTISAVRVEGNPAEAAVYTDKEFGTAMLFARWEPGVEERNLRFSFAVERLEVIRRDFPDKEAAWDPRDYALWLAPTALGPTDGDVKALAQSITKGKKTVSAKARAIYDWTVENMYRDPGVLGCGPGDVCGLLQKPGGKCADIHSVYVALARAAGVPSREVFGIRLGKNQTEDITTWQHCWAEFYLPGYGWVPVDPSDVRKAMLTEKLELADPRTAELREYFWGGIEPYRVQLSQGRDLILSPAQQGAPLNYFMYPYTEVGGKVLDWLDPASFKYAITYRQ